MDKGPKSDKKCLKNTQLFFSAREKVFNNFKNRAFLIINQVKTLIPEPVPEPTPKTSHKPKPETTREPTSEPTLEPTFEAASDLTVFDTPKTTKSKTKRPPFKLHEEFLNKIGSQEKKNLNNKMVKKND